MKFATTRIGIGAGYGAALLQPMLHLFRRIHAAKRSFRGQRAVDISGKG
jgi:hypothetical protein